MTTSVAAELDAAVAGATVPRKFLDVLAEHGHLEGLHAVGADGGWQTWTWNEVGDLTAQAATGLAAAGVSAGDRVLLMMRNRPDFHWLDLAAQFLRATPVSIYNSSSTEEIAYLAEHAEAAVAIVEDSSFLDRLLSAREQLPKLTAVYVIDAPDPMPDGVRSVSELFAAGTADLAELATATDADDLATLIYTSGTTGPPKGVMISQHNVAYTVEMLRRAISLDRLAGRRVVSYLPMAHIAERMVSHYQAAILGYSVYCCPDAGQLTSYLKEVRPEIMFGVPRVFEKIYLGINAALAADPERKQQFDGAVSAALAVKSAERDGTVTDEQRASLAFLDEAAFANVRALVGLDALVLAITGAAPLPASVIEWFNAIGVPLSEIYGMSETSGPMCWAPWANKPGSGGPGVPGCEVRIADDGEVECRGGNVFVGYLKQPEKTAEAIVNGWLHSGDIGEMDDDGYVRIVDRKKELIITSGGKNISPANLEAALKMIPLVGQAAAIGDNRKFVSAILVLDPESAAVWAAANGKSGMSLAELASDPDIIAEVQRRVDRVNEQFAQVEQIKRFTLVGEEWLPDSDVLTPTSKLKRRGVNARYEAEIEAMYA
jgi:long-chain acyl-CoA synthetase